MHVAIYRSYVFELKNLASHPPGPLVRPTDLLITACRMSSARKPYSVAAAVAGGLFLLFEIIGGALYGTALSQGCDCFDEDDCGDCTVGLGSGGIAMLSLGTQIQTSCSLRF